MLMTQKQQAIINYLKAGERQKSQIVNRFSAWYYHNASKYIGEILGRMVEAGMIIRVKKGLYRLPDLGTDTPRPPADEHQMTLF